jgi:hypothetical protein
MHSINTCEMYEGFCIGCKNTAKSFLFLFTVSIPLPHHNQRSMRLIVYYHYPVSPTLLAATSDTTHTIT